MTAPPARSYLPWRSATVGWVVAAALIAYGVPLFLRMPPWCDLTLYDVAARNVMTGGTHYRDVFDTNPPGFVWAMIAVRRLFGDSVEAVRLVDLGVVAAISVLLMRFARQAGATRATVAWMAAGVAFFYPFTSEFNHAQRDVWMLLPAVIAVRMRVKRILAGQGPFWPAVVEGIIWGVAVWLKPHAIIPAAGVWVATVGRLMATDPYPWRAFRRDLFGSLAGGLLVGVAGYSWMIATGASGPYWDVMTKWNRDYGSYIFWETPFRLTVQFAYFPPVSYALPVALVVAAVNAWRIHVGRRDATVPPETFVRGVLAVLFLSWAFQAVTFQRMFPYIHVPETLMMFAVLAANRLAVTPAVLAYGLFAGLMWAWLDERPASRKWVDENLSWHEYAVLPRHATGDQGRIERWPGCFRFGLPERDRRQRQAELSLFPMTFATPAPVDSLEVADELRRLGVRDGEVICWHNTPHQVYLDLGIRPGFRFMHIEPAFTTLDAYERMKIELIKKQPGVKYVVSDLIRVWTDFPPGFFDWREPGKGTDLLPPMTPGFARSVWPLTQPTVFRSGGGKGRFVIHRLDTPLGPFDDCMVPNWPKE